MKTLSCQKRDSSLSSRRLTIAGLFLVGLMASLVIGISTAAGAQPPTYAIQDLGVVPGMTDVVPTHINSNGDVVGIASAGEEKCAAGYKAYGKGMQDLGGLGSRAFALNDVGIAVGDANFQGPGAGAVLTSHAAFFKGGLAYDLGTPEGALYSRANDINASEQIVGFSSTTLDGPYSRAFVWTNQTMQDLGTLGGAFAQANAINDNGFVTGWSQTATAGANLLAQTHAFVYQLKGPGSPIPPMRDLGTLGGFNSYGTCINASNHVVGYSDISKTNSLFHGFFYNGEKMLDLGSLAGNTPKGDYSAALGINSSDQVVGYTFIPTYPATEHPVQVKQVAFIWSNHGQINKMIDLNTLTGRPGVRYYLFSAVAINDNGQIAASAYVAGDSSVHTVLLTPIKTQYPPPAP
jgi:probable HAF family extracellular repeat protein